MLFIAVNVLCILFVIAVHEFGHFFAAKWCGITPPNFSVGIGRELVSASIRGTRFSLRLVPLGGYVIIPQEEIDALSRKKRIALYAAGPLANLLLCIVVGIIGSILGNTHEFVSGNPFVTMLYFLISAVLTVVVLIGIVVHPIDNAHLVSGPIGIMSGQALAEIPMQDLPIIGQALTIVYLISLALGTFNLLPLSFLDGGRIFSNIFSGFPRFVKIWDSGTRFVLYAFLIYALGADVIKVLIKQLFT